MAKPQKDLETGRRLANEGHYERALHFFGRLIGSDPGWAAQGRIESGIVFKKRGDLAGAARFYQQVIDSGHPDWAPCAAYNMGVLLAESGNRPAAITAYTVAVKSGHPEWAPRAALNLGVALREADDPVHAAAAYQIAIDSGHRISAPQASLNLGILLTTQGDVAGARRAYQTAIDSGSAEWAPAAAVNLGVLLARQADLEGAEAAYQVAIKSGHKRWAQSAATNLAIMRKPDFDPESAEFKTKESRWSGKLRDGEKVTFETTVLTPGKDITRHNPGVRHEITVTNQRIRIGQLSFDFEDVASWKAFSWDPSTETVAYKIKRPMRRSFTIVGKDGTRAEIEFSDGVPGNRQVFDKLEFVAQANIQPLLDAARRRRQDALLPQLRAGQTVHFKTPAGKILFSVTRNGFSDPKRSGEGEIPWSAFAGATLHRGKLTVQIRDAKGKVRDYISFAAASSLADLLTQCASEFAQPAS
jgi:tetratricopeptide (TPR) repeat protein